MKERKGILLKNNIQDNKMKKFMMILLIGCMIFTNSISIKASDSASTDAYGYTLKGSIYDTYISASATGNKSSNVNVQLTNAYYINTAGNSIKASNKSAMTYVSYYGSSIGAAFFKWDYVTVKGTDLSTNYTTTLRKLYN